MDTYLPLKPVVYYILLALFESECHGYGVIQSVRERSQGQIQLETGPFYRHLRKLIGQRFVEESPDRPADADVRRGAYYRLTDAGRALLAAEGRRMRHLVELNSELGVVE